MKTIAIANQKGGVGKTTTAFSLASELKRRGHKVLAIDLDSQCSLTLMAGINQDGPTSYGIIAKEVSIAQAIIPLDWFDLIQGSKSLAVADRVLPEGFNRNLRIREPLAQIANVYDFCVLDCPPAVDIVTTNALAAADYVVIPAEANELSTRGIGKIYEGVVDTKSYLNPNIVIAGILLTRYKRNTNLARDYHDYFDQLAEGLDSRVFKTEIRETISLSEITSLHIPIFAHRPNSPGAEDYQKVTDELLEIMEAK